MAKQQGIRLQSRRCTRASNQNQLSPDNLLFTVAVVCFSAHRSQLCPSDFEHIFVSFFIPGCVCVEGRERRGEVLLLFVVAFVVVGLF